MKKFYFTFMFSQYALKEYYVEIEADSENEARAAMIDNFGTKWGFCYSSLKFDQSVFSEGCLITIKQQY